MAKKIHGTRGAIVTDVASTRKYMQELKQFESLSKAEEIELALAAQSGCEASYNKLITNNLRFVAQVAKQYQGMGVALEDLIAFGKLSIFKSEVDSLILDCIPDIVSLLVFKAIMIFSILTES